MITNCQTCNFQCTPADSYCGRCGRAEPLTPHTQYFCNYCGCNRKTLQCQKCGNPTKAIDPKIGWEDLKLPDIEKIRSLAKEVGYSIGLHGTLERDLDLIAAPWTEEAMQYTYRDVMEHIAKGMDGRVVEVELKPLGRHACTIQLNGWFKPIDLSVCPMICHNSNIKEAS
jgi:hypothetical protein